MGRADSDNAGGSGNTGGGRGGSSGGSSGGGGGGFGRDTPGSPNAADGRRGSSMGRDGGTAPDSSNPGGRDTPGPRNATDGRRGSTMGRGGGSPGADGSTPASRARDAMSRHAQERAERAGYQEGYSLVGELKKAEEEGTMTPRQRDMAIGMEAGMESKGFMDTASGMLSRGITAISDTVGLGKLGATAAEAGMNAAAVPDNPESRYGATVARNRMDNNMVQDAAQAAAGFFGGPAAGMAVGAINTATNLNANKDIASLNADIDARESASRPSRPGSTGGGTASSARDAMSRNTTQAATAPGRRPFEWSPVDLTKYKKGLMRPYMK